MTENADNSTAMDILDSPIACGWDYRGFAKAVFRTLGLAKYHKKGNENNSAATETAVENPLLAYKQQFENLPQGHNPSKFTWSQIAERLMSHPDKLAKVQAMQGGGHLFYINQYGQMLFKDKGAEPVRYGFNNNGELFQVCSSNDESAVSRWANYYDVSSKVEEDGYKMFSDDGNYGFSKEMTLAANVNDEGLFTSSSDRKGASISWLESGRCSVSRMIERSKRRFARVVAFDPRADKEGVYGEDPRCEDDCCGVIRLLKI